MHKHPAIVLQYGTGNVLVMKCAQHGTHLVLAHLQTVVSPCHFEVREADELLAALEAGGGYGPLELSQKYPDRRYCTRSTKGGGWCVQVFHDEPDVTWFSFTGNNRGGRTSVALNADGRRQLRAAVMETLFGKEARA